MDYLREYKPPFWRTEEEGRLRFVWYCGFGTVTLEDPVNLESYATRRANSTARIRDAVQVLAEQADLETEAQTLATIQEPDPRVKDLKTLEALAAILEKVANIEGGTISAEPSVRISRSEADELQRLRESVPGTLESMEGEPGPGIQLANTTMGNILPPAGPAVIDEGTLYELGRRMGDSYRLPVALVTDINGARQTLATAELHPEQARALLREFHNEVAAQAAYVQEFGAETVTTVPAEVIAQSGPSGEPIEPSPPGAQLDPSVFDAKQREALALKGYDTDEKILAMSDQELDAVPTIGEATIAKFRASHPEPQTIPEDQVPPPSPPTAAQPSPEGPSSDDTASDGEPAPTDSGSPPPGDSGAATVPPTPGDQPATIGEKGPETFEPGPSGQVVPPPADGPKK